MPWYAMIFVFQVFKPTEIDRRNTFKKCISTLFFPHYIVSDFLLPQTKLLGLQFVLSLKSNTGMSNLLIYCRNQINDSVKMLTLS